MELSFAICTYNRFELTMKCINSIFEAYCPHLFRFEILLIDNGSKDRTPEIPELLNDNRLVYCYEPRQGLSYARNRALDMANAPWLVYIDDDALIHHDFIDNWLKIKGKEKFVCIGGKYLAYFENAKPKWWPQDWGTKPDITPEFSEISTPELSGGVLFLNLKLLPHDIRFRGDLGMKGGYISYGEENYFQSQLLERGLKLAYAPELKIDHLVASRKISILWQLKNAYLHGKLTWMKSNRKKPPFYKGFRAVKTITSEFIQNCRHAFKKISGPNYYFQNLILETSKPLLLSIGKALGKENDEPNEK